MRWSGWVRALIVSTALVAGAAGARDLYPGRGYPAGDLPAGIAVADLDGDGLPDVGTPPTRRAAT